MNLEGEGPKPEEAGSTQTNTTQNIDGLPYRNADVSYRPGVQSENRSDAFSIAASLNSSGDRASTKIESYFSGKEWDAIRQAAQANLKERVKNMTEAGNLLDSASFQDAFRSVLEAASEKNENKKDPNKP